MKWYKASNNLSSHPRIKLAAVRGKTSKTNVLSVFHCMLESCSRNGSDAYCSDIKKFIEDLEVQLEISSSDVSLSISGLKEVGWVTNNTIAGWSEYQADTSAKRVQKHRILKKQQVDNDVTLQNVTNVTGVTVTQRRGEEKRREEKRREEKRREEKRREEKRRERGVAAFCSFRKMAGIY